MIYSSAICQSISNLVKRDWTLIDGGIQKITEVITSKTGAREKSTSIYHFNRDGQHIKREDFGKTGKRIAQVQYGYDSKGRLVKSIIENWNSTLGHKIDTIKYQFQNDNLLLIRFVDKNGITTSYSEVNYENDLPIVLTSFYPNGQIIGIEKAEYSIETNRFYTWVTDFSGKIIGSKTQHVLDNKIEITSEITSNQYNENGDLTLYFRKRCFTCDDYVMYEVEYDYNDQNDWIFKKIYKRNNKKRKLYEKIERQIEYFE